MSEGVKSLVWLNLSACKIGDEGLGSLLSGNPMLEVLRLSMLCGNECLTDEGLSHGLRWTKRLKEADLSGTRQVGSRSLAAICRYCKELQLLSLAGCVRIGDQDMISLSQSRGVANLRHIDLCGCEDLSAEGVGRFLRAGENLRCVNLNMIPAITEDAIEAMQCDVDNESLMWVYSRSKMTDAKHSGLKLPNAPPPKEKKGGKGKKGKGGGKKGGKKKK